MKNVYVVLMIVALLGFSSCKKDKMVIDEEKEFVQVDPALHASVYDAGWHLTLKPGGMAEILPGGDIVYRGTYKISGSSLKIKCQDDSFEFEILSDTDIKEKQYGTILRWGKK